MRPSYIFIGCLVLVAFCSMAQSENSNVPDKCCFTFSNAIIPVSKVLSYYTTRLECVKNGVIVITTAGKESCTDPTKRWVQRLMKFVDSKNLKQMNEGSSDDSS